MDTLEDVLVVDDDPDMTEVMVRILGLEGYSARTAANGKEALEAVAAKKPGLVLLDMLMPVMDGWQCARELRARYGSDLPIVVVTAAEHVLARSGEIDADDVLAKPFDLGDLLNVISRYVIRRRTDETSH